MLRKPFVLVAVALISSAVLWMVGGSTDTEPPDRPDAAAAVAAPGPSGIDPAELDRLIGDFHERFAAFGGVTNGTTLGRLLRERAALTGDVADYGAAYEVLGDTVASAPGSHDARLLLAHAASDLHLFAEAHRLAAEVVAAQVDRLDAVALVGDTALALGDYDTARTSVDRLVAALPGRPEVLLRQAHVVALDGEVPRALALAARAADTAATLGLPAADQALYRSAHGALATELGLPAIGIASFDAALDLVAEYPPAIEGRGVALALLGDFEAAIADLATMTALSPDDLHAHLIFGDVLTRAGRLERAAEHFEMAEALEASDVHGLFRRQIASYEIAHGGDFERARALARTELEARQDAAGYDLAGWAEFHTGSLDEARRLADLGLELREPTGLALYHSAEIAVAQGETERAIEELRRALTINPTFDVLAVPAAERLLASLGG